MNSISGIGSIASPSISGLRNKEGFRDDALNALAPAIAPAAVTRAEAGYDHRSEQAYEESFAKLRVNLQSRAEADDVESGVGSGQLSQSQAEEDPVVKAFREYMEMTPAEKIRDSILKEMGLTEEEVDAMSPEQQKAVEEQIAERMQERAELQAAKEQAEEAEGNSSAGGLPEEANVLLS